VAGIIRFDGGKREKLWNSHGHENWSAVRGEVSGRRRRSVEFEREGGQGEGLVCSWVRRVGKLWYARGGGSIKLT